MEKSIQILDVIKHRWSPRAMKTDLLTEEEVMPLFEAARHAPSAYNSQPWRFLVIKRGSKRWNDIFSTLIQFNQRWAKNASMLVVVLSRTKFEGRETPAKNHSFDTGAAWMSLALEGSSRGIAVHAMEGFDYSKLKDNFQIPDLYSIEVIVSIGKLAPPHTLPDDLREKERPKERKPLSEIVSFDDFNFS